MLHSDSNQISGEEFSITDPSGFCAVGYQGVLCSICMRGYSKNDDKTCLPCGNWLNMLTFFLKLIFKFLIFGYMIYTAMMLGKQLKENTASKNLILSNFLIKILIGHFQFVRLILVIFSLNFGKVALHTMSFLTSVFISGPDLSMSLDCLEVDFGFPSKFVHTLFVALLPVIAVLFVRYCRFSKLLNLISSIKCIKKNYGSILKSDSFLLSNLIKLNSTWMSNIMICVMVSYDSIVINLMEYFPEINIGDDNYKEYRLLADLGIESTNKNFQLWRTFFVVPIIVIYVIGIPFLIFYKIFKSKTLNQLQNPRTLFRYGYFYFAYNEKFYFYELIYISRKMILIIIDIFFAKLIDFNLSYNAITFLVLLMGLFMASAGFSRTYKPFKDPELKLLNDIECFSFIAQALTSCLGCILLSFQLDNKYLSAIGRNDTIWKIILLCGAIINLIFFSAWCYFYWVVQARVILSGILNGFQKIILKFKACKKIPKKTGSQNEFIKIQLKNKNCDSAGSGEKKLISGSQNQSNEKVIDTNLPSQNDWENQSEKILLKLILKENKFLRSLVQDLELDIRNLRSEIKNEPSMTINQEDVKFKVINSLKVSPSITHSYNYPQIQAKANTTQNYKILGTEELINPDMNQIENPEVEFVDKYEMESIKSRSRDYMIRVELNNPNKNELSSDFKIISQNEGRRYFNYI